MVAVTGVAIAKGVAYAVAALASVYGASEAHKAGTRSGNAADKKARAEQVLTQAKLEDLKTEERALLGQTIAAAAGSRVKVDVGSPLQIYAEQARQFARERQTVSQVGATKASAIMQSGNIGHAAEVAQYSQAAVSAAQAFAMFKGP